MPGLDTNVLVRWLVGDDVKQTACVQKLFESARADEAPLFVPCTVMLELEWVLRSRYGLHKAAVLETFNALLETQELEFQAEAALERALHLFRQGAAEFADCLHAGLCAAAGSTPLLTFDTKASRLAGAQLLEANAARSGTPASDTEGSPSPGRAGPGVLRSIAPVPRARAPVSPAAAMPRSSRS
jgi:predicted nucleic-acid-binding protein